MNPSRLFIERPVATSLLMIAVLLLGAVAYRSLPVSALPSVDYPTIQVTTLYPGASPEVMASSVTGPLERQFGQMPGLKQMTSRSSGGASVMTLQVDLALSPIGVAVRAGKPVPDISTAAKLRDALLAARSVVYSDSASGVYVRNELFKRLGIEAEMASKAHVIPATPVAEIVARGEADLGLQQVAELLPVQGIVFAGRLPADVQKVTVYSAAIATGARHPDAGRALIDYLGGPAAAPVLAQMGLEKVKP